MLKRVALAAVILVLVSSCGFFPLPVSYARTDLLVRSTEAGIGVLFCPEVEISEVSISARDRETGGRWGDYYDLVDEDVTGWTTGPHSPIDIPLASPLRPGMQLDILLTGTRAGEEYFASTLIEIGSDLKTELASGSWISADGIPEVSCAPE